VALDARLTARGRGAAGALVLLAARLQIDIPGGRAIGGGLAAEADDPRLAEKAGQVFVAALAGALPQ
jgi:hypothetical protein